MITAGISSSGTSRCAGACKKSLRSLTGPLFLIPIETLSTAIRIRSGVPRIGPGNPWPSTTLPGKKNPSSFPRSTGPARKTGLKEFGFFWISGFYGSTTRSNGRWDWRIPKSAACLSPPTACFKRSRNASLVSINNKKIILLANACNSDPPPCIIPLLRFPPSRFGNQIKDRRIFHRQIIVR